ncbi:lysophospholipid acyltransferase family protein [Azomonas macrocytogenes]|uniref:1-acyl-sn-glycerol-3-phosphate acyltransferase n=1 Tax=Azomonas macrocytogenes TaxID=69962 RepID=A0A839T149_AZOMA|nr:lysophospholipid acyltransferase family protein [Azomonas macrocytogenes]MBB3103271.1 1-acyl-sn-glycerol-3-phosphate acyltransferase [Azomonas macrocytogenes]
MTLTYKLRIVLLYAYFGLTAGLWCLVGVTCAPFLSTYRRYRLVAHSWCHNAIRATQVLVDIDYRVIGQENIPERPCVILANHQSAWETFFLTGSFFSPLTQVLKRELLDIPFFGWAIRLIKPIAIDRDNPKMALKQVAIQGHERLQQGIWVLIFPEGTRVPVGEPGKFSRSGAALAANAGLPILPIAHNAGSFWPRTGWSKRPGTIQVVIGPPLLAEGEGPRAIAELNQRAEQWIHATVKELESQV